MGEISKAVGDWIVNNVGWSVLIVLFLFCTFFEFSKIKLNPISALCRRIGNGFTAGLKKYIDELKEDTNKQIAALDEKTIKKLDEIQAGSQKNCHKMQAKLDEVEYKLMSVEERQDRQAASRIKAHVFNFAKECYSNVLHTKGDFENLIKENEEYEKLVAKHGWKNDVYKAEFEYIMRVYQKCKDEHKFQPTDI